MMDCGNVLMAFVWIGGGPFVSGGRGGVGEVVAMALRLLAALAKRLGRTDFDGTEFAEVLRYPVAEGDLRSWRGGL